MNPSEAAEAGEEEAVVVAAAEKEAGLENPNLRRSQQRPMLLSKRETAAWQTSSHPPTSSRTRCFSTL